MDQPRNPIIFPLDVSGQEEAERLLRAVGHKVGLIKVGQEFTTATGVPNAIQTVHDFGGKVFLDLKLTDIPNTVGKAVAAAAKQGVYAMNLHASAGREAIKAAVQNRGNSRIWGVTVLTSLDKASCKEIFGTDDIALKVLQFALMLAKEGAQGVICSPKEIAVVRQMLVNNGFLDFEIVTPGVRPTWAAANDQKRVMTPDEAIKAGADWIVIGRPISDPPTEIGSPENAITHILGSLAATKLTATV